MIASGSTSAALTDGPPLIWVSDRQLEHAHGLLAPGRRDRFRRGIPPRLHRAQGRIGLVLGQNNRARSARDCDRHRRPWTPSRCRCPAGDAGVGRRLPQLRLRHVPALGLLLGANDNGQTGNGTTLQSATPVAVPNTDFPVVRALSAAHRTTSRPPRTAITCLGMNSEGQLGDGTTTSRASAAYIASDNTVQAGAGRRALLLAARRRVGLAPGPEQRRQLATERTSPTIWPGA